MSEEEKKKEIESWSPSELARSFEELWRDFYREFRPWGLTPRQIPKRLLKPEEGWDFTPLVDVVDEGDKFMVRADIPGFDKENVDIQVTEDFIELSGKVSTEKKEEKEKYKRYERSYSSFSRTIQLPEDIKPDQASASLKNGVLEVKLPKVEPTEPEKKHKVNVE